MMSRQANAAKPPLKSWAPHVGETVTDENGSALVLGPMLSYGGQGAVYKVQNNSKLAIKILKDRNDLKRIRRVRRLDLEGINVSGPKSVIDSNHFGYLMPIAGEMETLRTRLIRHVFFPGELDLNTYFSTGGLRRRLEIAASISSTMSKLHSKGLVFVDLHPGNVMISANVKNHETWLIDTDNLEYFSTVKSKLGFSGYVAPERRFSPPSPHSDSYSLAVLIFQLLILRHPYVGKKTDGIPADDVVDMIIEGDLPYIFDPFDTTNEIESTKRSNLLFRHSMSNTMKRLSLETFGFDSLDFRKRPTASEWRDALQAATDDLLDCDAGCGWSFFSNESTCINCGQPRPNGAILEIYAENSMNARCNLAIAEGGEYGVLPRHLWGIQDYVDPIFELVWAGDGFELVTNEGFKIQDSLGSEIRHIPFPIGQSGAEFMLKSESQPNRRLKFLPMDRP